MLQKVKIEGVKMVKKKKVFSRGSRERAMR